MRSLVIPFLVAAVGIAGPARADDTYELNPHRAEVVVAAAWGELEHEYAPHNETWGVAEAGRFGAFTLDEDGCLYIADEGSNTVKIYEPDGAFLHAVSMQAERNLVDDLAVHGGEIFWLREWPGRPTKVYSLKPDADGFGEITVTGDPDLTRDFRGNTYAGNGSLVSCPGGIGLYARQLSYFVPLTATGNALPPREQAAAKRRGLAVGDHRIAQILFPTETAAGDAVRPGDVVHLDATGEIVHVLAARPGHLLAVKDDFFLTTRAREVQDQWRPYWVLFDARGQELSRTRMPIRAGGLNIEIPNSVRLGPDGVFYELVVDRDGVSVVRYVP